MPVCPCGPVSWLAARLAAVLFTLSYRAREQEPALSDYLKGRVDEYIDKLTPAASEATLPASVRRESAEGEAKLIYGTCFGYLNKLTSGKGLSRQKWKKRWFTIKADGTVVYCKTAKGSTDETEPVHYIDLYNYKISIATEFKGATFQK